MNIYKISLNNGSLVWTCKATTEEEAWAYLSSVKNLPVNSLKQLFKIKQDDVRTNDNNGLLYDQKSSI